MDFTEFITSPAGIAIFCIVAAAIVIFFLAVNYRFFTKNVLDFVFGLLAFIITRPARRVRDYFKGKAQKGLRKSMDMRQGRQTDSGARVRRMWRRKLCNIALRA